MSGSIDSSRSKKYKKSSKLGDDLEDDIPEFLSKYEKVYGRVKDYVLFEEIGRGTQGTVYKCLNLVNKRVYAIKSLENSSLSRRKSRFGSSLNSLKNEINIMKALNHKNLVKLYDVIDEPKSDKLHLVMDYIQGGNVMGDQKVMLNPGSDIALSEDTARNLFGQFVLAIEYLHQQGVLHRDIKPSNMLIDNNTDDGLPLLKVCDFGVSSMCNFEKSAKLLGEDDVIYGGVCGTVAMMSPEALGAGPDNYYHGRPADVWAAGVTLFCMLFGCLPFKASNFEEAKKSILEANVVFPSKPRVSQEAKNLILQMLQKNPHTRVTMSLVREDLWFNGAFCKDPDDAYREPTEVASEGSGLGKIIRRTRSRGSRTSSFLSWFRCGRR